MTRNWFRSLFTRPGTHTIRNAPAAPRGLPRRRSQVAHNLRLQLLEDRTVPTAVAVLGAEYDSSWIEDVRSKVESTGLFTTVDAVDVLYSTPTLAQLEAYDAVLVWSDSGFADPTALGDNLAQFVDDGHGVVLATFTNTHYAPLGGRWASEGYDAVQPNDYWFGPLTLGAVAQPGHPIMDGVTTFDGGFGSYHSVGGLTPGSSLIASWSNGDVLVAEKSNHNVGLNFFPVSSDAFPFYGWDSSTQGALLMGNALSYVSSFGVSGTVPAGGSTVFTHPAQYTVNVSDPVDPASLDAADFQVNGQPATGVAYTPGTASITFTFATDPVAAQGLQTMYVAAGAFASASDGSGTREFDGSFRYDAVLMAVTSTAPAVGSTITLPATTLDLNFNEPYALSSAQAGDFTVSQGSVASVGRVDADTLRLTLSGVMVEGTLTVSMPAGAMTDAYGNAGAAFSGSYTLDFGTAPFPTPLAAAAPAGSLVYQGTQAGIISPAGDSDSFSVLVDPGQKITVTIDPAATLRPVVELYRGNALVGTATAGSAGLEAVLQAVATQGQLGAMGPGPTAYTVTVRGAGGTAGGYTARMTLNAAVEGESHDGAANNTRAAAQSLDPAFLTFNASAGSNQSGPYPGRAAVLGRHDEFAVSTVYGADFESGAQGFTVDNGPTSGHLPGLWHYSEGRGAQPGHTAGHSFYYGVGEGPDGGGTTSLGTQTPTAGTVTSPSIALPVGGALQLDFNYVLQTRGFPGDVDSADLQINGGSGWTSLRRFDRVAESSEWRTSDPVDLTAYAGQTVQLRWSFDTVRGPRDRSAEGWYLDDVRIRQFVPVADYYSFTLAAGESATLALKNLSAGTLTLAVENAAGATVATGATTATNVENIVSDFVAPATGTYYARVLGTNTAGTDYDLVVTRNAEFDTEGNDTPATAQNVLATQAAGRQWALGAVQSGAIDHSGGFADPSDLVGNGSASFTGGVGRLTDGGFDERGSFFSRDTVSVTGFDTTFTFQLLTGNEQMADGITFTIQGVGSTALGIDGGGSGLAYQGIPSSVAVKFDTYDGPPASLTGLYTGGASPVQPSIDLLPSGIDLTNQHPFAVAMHYDGAVLSVTITDTITLDSASQSYTIDIPAQVGGSQAFVGFTGATGGLSSVQDILSWKFQSGSASDFYRVVLAAGQLLEVDTATPGSRTGVFGNSFDPAVRVYDAGGHLVAFDDNSAPDGRNARVRYNVPPGTGGVYSIEVTTSAATPTPTGGEYFLSVKGNLDGEV